MENQNQNQNQVYVYKTNNRIFDVRDNLEIGKIQLIAIEYVDGKATKQMKHYVDALDMMLLAWQVLNNQLAEKNNVYWTEYKGTSANKANRPDKKAESRVLKLQKGQKLPFVWELAKGPGKENDQGAISPDGQPEEKIFVGMSSWDISKMMLVVYNYLVKKIF